mgnify:FL=1
MYFREEEIKQESYKTFKLYKKKTYYFHKITMGELTDNCFGKIHNDSANVDCYDFDSALAVFKQFAIRQYIFKGYTRETEDFNIWRKGDSKSDISKIAGIFSVGDEIYVLTKQKNEYRNIIF